ncbi:MAG TPA: HAD family phosphatase [Mariniphaga sp.]|nr:HAD family phosphatase [Mariniphaga sp.]
MKGKINKNEFSLNSFDAVIFDMDGVLVNSEPHYIQLEQNRFNELGLTILEDEHKTYQGTATDRMWQIIKEKHGVEASVEELVNRTNAKVSAYFTALESIEVMTGVEQFIKKLKEKNISIALASSSHAELIEIILEKSHLQMYFDVVVDSRMAGASKPEPDIFLLAAKKLDVTPKRCVVIEDSTNGIKAAKTANMYCIAYAGPGSELQDQSQADLIISDFRELLKF